MKKLIKILTVLFIVAISIIPSQALSESPILYSEYAYAYDPDSKIVYIDEKSNDKMYPASMTKVLTVSVALEKIKDLSQKVTVIRQDFDTLQDSGATLASFNPADKVTYKDLIYGALLPSGADACNILARTLYGSYQGMVDAMNDKAKELNLTNSHFMNVTGLHDDNHYTTAKDMASILNDALENKDFETAFHTNSYQDSSKKRTWVSALSRAHTLKQLDVSPLSGGKSGFTDKAQLTLASTMTIDGKTIILITAKADGQKTQNHVRDALKVYQYITDNYHKVVIYKKAETIHQYWILQSFDGIYSIQAKEEMSILVEKAINEDNIDIKYNGASILSAPIKENVLLGKISINHNDLKLCEYQILADDTIDNNIVAIVIHYLLLFGIPVIIIFISVKKIKSKH